MVESATAGRRVQRTRIRALRFGIGLLALATAASARRAYLDVPAASWEEVAPYVRANVVPFLDGDEFFFQVCTGVTCRAAVEPFDAAVSDFVKVLLLQRMYRDDRFAAAMSELGDAFRARIPKLTPEERERYREIFWRELDRRTYVAAAVRADYEKAQRKGRLRCWICEKDPSYRPAGLE